MAIANALRFKSTWRHASPFPLKCIISVSSYRW